MSVFTPESEHECYYFAVGRPWVFGRLSNPGWRDGFAGALGLSKSTVLRQGDNPRPAIARCLTWTSRPPSSSSAPTRAAAAVMTITMCVTATKSSVGSCTTHKRRRKHLWFWVIIAEGRSPSWLMDRGYAVSREHALAQFRARWTLDDLVCHRVVDLPTPPMPAFIARCVRCNAQIWVTLNSPSDVRRICSRCADGVSRSPS
jgi:hypothetical protein